MNVFIAVRRVLAEGKRKVVSEEEELKAASGQTFSNDCATRLTECYLHFKVM
jgi:hypothetical protein